MVGLTQEQLALECDLTFQQIHKYESGNSRMTSTRLVQIAQILEVPVAWFFDGLTAEVDVEDPLKSLKSDPEAITLLHQFTRIRSTKRRKQLLAFAELLVEEEK